MDICRLVEWVFEPFPSKWISFFFFLFFLFYFNYFSQVDMEAKITSNGGNLTLIAGVNGTISFQVCTTQRTISLICARLAIDRFFLLLFLLLLYRSQIERCLPPNPSPDGV